MQAGDQVQGAGSRHGSSLTHRRKLGQMMGEVAHWLRRGRDTTGWPVAGRVESSSLMAAGTALIVRLHVDLLRVSSAGCPRL